MVKATVTFPDSCGLRRTASSWQVRSIIEAARPVFAESALQPGYEVRAILMPSLAKPNGEPVRFSVFDDSGVHKVTVTRNAAGEYLPSATPTEERISASVLGESDQLQDKSLYSSLAYTAAKQGVPDDLIMQIMRIHRPNKRIWLTALKDWDPPLTCMTASVLPWVGRTAPLWRGIQSICDFKMPVIAPCRSGEVHTIPSHHCTSSRNSCTLG